MHQVLYSCAADMKQAAAHAMRATFQDAATDAVIFVDASNAFNNLNRKVALLNVQFICPSIATILINCYRRNTCLFAGGSVLYSREGITQGDPLAMAMFALATVPLINAVATPGTIQAWFADDAASGGVLQRIREWWDCVVAKGPAFGYYPNAGKTYLLVKTGSYDEAVKTLQCKSHWKEGTTLGVHWALMLFSRILCRRKCLTGHSKFNA